MITIIIIMLWKRNPEADIELWSFRMNSNVLIFSNEFEKIRMFWAEKKIPYMSC